MCLNGEIIMAYFVKRNSEWLNWIAPEKFNDEDLFRIVIFFVFHSPCQMLSSMGRTLLEYGWREPWKKPYFLNKQLAEVVSSPKLIVTASKYEEMEKKLEEADLKDDFPSNLLKERICIYNCENNQFMSIFRHLRNSLAHCRLNIIDVNGECVLVFEDVRPAKNADKLEVSARMILKKSTLIKWIDIIESGERTYIIGQRENLSKCM